MNDHRGVSSQKGMSVLILSMLLFSHVTILMMSSGTEASEQLMDANEVDGGKQGLRVFSGNNLAQSFYATGSYTLTKVSLVIKDIGTDDPMIVNIYSNNETGTPGDPNDDVPESPLGSSGSGNGPDNIFAWVNFTFSIPLIAGERYWIVASNAQVAQQNGYRLQDSDGDTYPAGYLAAEGVPSWIIDLNNDLMFRIYGEVNIDVGVSEILSPAHIEVYEEGNFTAAIGNFGGTSQGPFDVNIVMKDPYGTEVMNTTRTITSLSAGTVTNLSWLYTPLFGGTYKIAVTTLLAGDEFNANNATIRFVEVHARPVLKLHDAITIDGLYNDWDAMNLPVDNTWNTSYREYIWYDAQGDDRGDGDYVYPNNPRFEGGCLDLLEFRVAVDPDSINFLLIFNSIDDGSGDGTDGPLGFSEQIIEILIDTNRNGTGRDDSLRNARLKLDKELGWEYALWADGWGNGYAEDAQGNVFTSLSARGSPVSNAVEISIPAIGSLIPDFEVWRYMVLIGAQDDLSLPDPIEGSQSGFMRVDGTETSTSGGGGVSLDGADSNVYDLAFANPQDDQLNNYGLSEIILASYTDTSSPMDSNQDINESWAQSFSAPLTSLLSSVDIYAKDVGVDSPGTMNVIIQTNNDKGTPDPSDDEPSGVNVSSSEVIDFTPAYEWQNIIFSNPPTIREGETYWIVATCPDAPGDGYSWGKMAGDPFSGGVSSRYSGGLWGQQTDDLIFAVYYRSLTSVDAYQAIHFAPIIINELDAFGPFDEEWINIMYSGTNNAPDLVMDDWILTDQDGNDFNFNGFNLPNKNAVTIHTDSGINTSSELFWNLPFEVWNDFGDDALLYADLFIPIDFMNYTDGSVFGDPAPSGIKWGPESDESLPKNPDEYQTLSLNEIGGDNDLFRDWGLNAIGLVEEKTFYLHDDRGYDIDNIYDFMDTIPPTNTTVDDFDLDANPGLTIRKSLLPKPEQSYQKFNLTPNLASDFNIADDVIVDLWMDNNGVSALETITITLYESDGVTDTEIASQTDIVLFDPIFGWEMISIIIPDVVHTLSAGNYLVLDISADGSLHNLWLAYNSTSEPSRIRVVPTRTFVNVSWVKLYDTSEVEKYTYVFMEEVIVRANVTDPLGSYDIDGANITIISPGGFTYFFDVPMTLNATDASDPSFWKLYNFSFNQTNETGLYTVMIKGIESNGVVHVLTIYFNVLGGVPPMIITPSVTPIVGSAQTSFNFTMNYTDFDDDAPGDIYVFINGLGQFNLSELDPSDTNYIDGKEFFVNLSGLVNGTDYSFYFRAYDNKGLWNQTVTFPGPIVVNTPPVLSDFGLVPSLGKAVTDFNFTVNYTDFDNQPPDSIFVNITGPSHVGSWIMMELDPSDTDYTDGKLYYYNYTGFFNGTYFHHFAANDSMGDWSESIELPGPLVESTPLMLLLPDVIPVLGYITTEFNFTVTYLNLDNIAPSNFTVNITGPSHSGEWTMMEVNPSDINYVDGKEYYYSYTGFIIGNNYSFHFAASAQNSWNETIEMLRPDVLNTPPVLSNYDLSPFVGSSGTTMFNYTVTYSDMDNQAPSNVTLNITGPFSGDLAMFEVDPLDNDYSDGKEYYFETTLPLDGVYSFRIESDDSGGVWAVPIIDSGPGVGGALPLLSQPKVDPGIGITTTWYNFTVVYADLQNDSAGTINLNLTGPENLTLPMQELDPLDTNTTDGKIFYVNITGLHKGQYTFNMEGNDSLGNFTTSQFRVAPLVQNSPPMLLGSYINESEMGGSWFNFTLTVSDIDNDTSGNVNLNLIGYGNVTMFEVDPLDNDLSDGKDYYLNLTLPKGSYLFRFEASDSGFGAVWNYTVFQWINLTDNIPIISEDSVSPSTGFGGDWFNFTLNVTDYDNDSLEVWLYLLGGTSEVYPMTELDVSDITTSDGKYYYINLTLDKYVYTYYFWVSDGNNSNQSIPQILVVANNLPIIITPDVVNIDEDSIYNTDYNHTELDGDLVLWNLTTNATWLSIDPATGQLTGTPTNFDVGTFYVNVSVDDGDGGIDYHNFIVNVTNTPPEITTIPITSIEENAPLSDDFQSTDEGQGTIIYSLETNATWLSINPATGLLSGTPDSTEIGSYWVNVNVSDGNGGYDSINYTINVTNKPPVITTIPITVAFEDLNHIDDFNSDNDIPFITLYYLKTNATWLSISNITGILSSSVPPDNTQVGWYWVNVTVDDGNGGIGYINYTLTVINAPPSIDTIPITSVDEDSWLINDFNCNDDGQGIIKYSLNTNATWLILDDDTGVLSGNTDNSHVGWYRVNISVEDGNGGIDYINYNLTVVNLPPTITTSPVNSVLEDIEYVVDFNCIDDGQGTITYLLNSNATWLTIDPVSGILNGTANNTLVGWYWVNVTVLDGNGGSDFRNYTLTVINSPPTIITTPIVTAFEDVPFYQDFDSEDDGQGTIVYTLITNAGWLVIDPATGEVSGTPVTDDIGSYWANVSVSDGQGGISSLNYSLEVENTNDPPEITSANTFDAVEDTLYNVDYDFFDIDGDSVTWTLGTRTNATWLSIFQGTGVLTGTPLNDDVGWFLINITASDGNGGFDYTEFILTVSNTNDAPGVPDLVFPSDDSTIDSVNPTFSWDASIDPDFGDHIVSYTLEYSPASDFSQNVTSITDITETSYALSDPLLDKSTYYWRVSAFDSNGVSSGFQSPNFVFAVDTGYEPPSYGGGLKSFQVKMGKSWSVDLSSYFELGSITEGITFSSNYDEIVINPVTHIATWTPKKKSDELTDVTFTVSDGVNEITSNPLDLSVEKEVAEMTIWERILWPYPLLSLVVVFVLGAVVLYRRIIYAPQVERVFLIHEHSILITHASVGVEHDVDEDILSGMLAGVKNLISDAFGSMAEGEVKEDLRKLEFGDRNILLEKGNHFFLAVVFKGKANKDLVSRIKSVISEIEDKYTDELEGWEGYTDAFEGIDEIIATLLPQVKTKEEEKEEIIVEVPEVEEFYGDEKAIEVPDFEETYEEEVYPEEYTVEVPEELEEEVIIAAPREKELVIEEVIEPPKPSLEDELDLALKDYIKEPAMEEAKSTLLPPPPAMKEPEKKAKLGPSPLPSGLERGSPRKDVLSEEDKKALPPPPWLKDKAPPDLLKSKKIEALTEVMGEPKVEAKPEVVEEPEVAPEPEVEEKPKVSPLAPPPKPEVVEEVLEEVVYEYECPSCGAGISEEMSKCPSCGTEFKFEEGGEELEEEITEYECPSCGASVTPDMTKCPECGVHFA